MLGAEQDLNQSQTASCLKHPSPAFGTLSRWRGKSSGVFEHRVAYTALSAHSIPSPTGRRWRAAPDEGGVGVQGAPTRPEPVTDGELPEASLTRLRHPLPVEREKPRMLAAYRSVALQLSFSRREKVARSAG